MKTSVRIGLYLCLWLRFTVLVCCELRVLPLDIFPPEPIIGENATLECKAFDFDTSMHTFLFEKLVNGTYVDLIASDRVVFSPVQQMQAILSIQTVTISHLQEADEGTYLCTVVAHDGTHLESGQGELSVNYLNEFPVCVPEGPTNVSEGDTLSCRTQTDTRTPKVRTTVDPSGVDLDFWLPTSLNVTEMVSELRKNVTTADNGLQYSCFSIANNTRKTLSCTIGPLSITPLQNPTTAEAPHPNTPLSIAAIVGIAAGGVLLLLLLLIHAVCCHCNPKRWVRPKSYFLNFTGIFGASAEQDDTDRKQPELEMGNNNLGRGEAPPQFAAYDQPAFMSEASDDENNPPAPASEPNIYVDHSVPGTSSQFVPDPTENWHEIDLKTELAEVLGDDE